LTAASHLETVSLSCERNWSLRVEPEEGNTVKESRTEKGDNRNDILAVVWNGVHLASRVGLWSYSK
jgi:hypothetical protein